MSPDPWTKGNGERDDIYRTQRAVGPNVDGGTESGGLPMESFDSWSHKEIKTASDAFDPESALEVSRLWAKLGSDFNDKLTNFKQTFDVAVNAAWAGNAAESAKQAISDYRDHAQKVADGMKLMSTKPAEAETAMTQVKALMPEPVDVAPMKENTAAEQRRWLQDDSARQQKENEARKLMTSIYQPVFQQASNGVPVLPQASAFGGGATPAASVSSDGYQTGKAITPDKTVTGRDASVSSAAFVSDPSGQGAGGAGGASSAGGFGGAAGAGALAGAGSGGGAGANTSGSSANPAAAVAAANGQAGIGYNAPPPSSVPGTFGIGKWSRPEQKKDEKPSESTSSIPPMIGPIVAGSYAAGAAIPPVTTSPMQGMGIAPPSTMVPPGATTQYRDDEDEHFTPEFLVSLDNGNSLVGPLPKVSPAVIGAWTEEHVDYLNPPPSPYDPRPRDTEE